MTGELQTMIRGAIGGAAVGGGIGGTAFGLIGAVMVGLEPVVFMVCGVYAGAVYGGIVGALRAAHDERVEPEPALPDRPQLEQAPALVRSALA
ncbi:MAG: hypothetical protein E6J25_04455 [Chloroflexi bacterium]|nr:MAG: hypothetical protein E6J25_04455 [Chloroflexota bacterium]